MGCDSENRDLTRKEEKKKDWDSQAAFYSLVKNSFELFSSLTFHEK